MRLSGVVSKVGKQEASSNHGPMKHKYATPNLSRYCTTIVVVAREIVQFRLKRDRDRVPTK